MSDQPGPAGNSGNHTVASMIIGTVLFTVTVAAWLYGAAQHIDTTVLWATAPPLIGALFLVQPIGRAGRAAQAAMIQTNGQLGDRIKSAVHEVMAERETYVAPTAQAAAPPLVPTATTPGSPPALIRPS